MQAYSLHVDYQLPNGYTWVWYLLDGIKCNDAPIQAAIAVVKEDNAVERKRSYFETAALHILPKDPVIKRSIMLAKRLAAQIPMVEDDGGDSGPKSGIGRTGVHFRYHTSTEFGEVTCL